jgi:hypothetical protein
MRSSTTRVLACTTALAAVAALPAAAPAQTLDKLVTISSGTIFTHCKADQVGSQPGTNFPGSAIEPWVAVDPTQAGHLLTGVQQDRWSDGGARGLRGAVSTNGGHNWRTTVPGGISQCTGGVFPRATDPWTAFGLDGTAYFFSLAFFNNPTPVIEGRSATLVNRSLDGGNTWQPPVTLIDDTDPLAFNDKNSITADSQIAGNVYAVWDRLYGPANAFKAPGGSDEHGAALAGAATPHDAVQMARNRIVTLRAAAASGQAPAQETFGPTYFSRTINSGVSWTRAVPIYDPGTNAQTIANIIVSMPSGDLLDFFDNIDSKGNLEIAYVRSADHGLSWSRARTTVAPLTGTAAVTPDSKSPIRDASILFSVSVDPNSGALYVAWEDVPPGGNLVATLYAQSTDAGKTWTAPVTISKTPRNAANPLRGQSFNPTIVAVPNDGSLVATYYDFRNDTAAAGKELADVWVIFCKPGATAAASCAKPGNWGHERRLTDKSFNIVQAPLTDSGFFLGDYFGLAAQGTNVWPAFTVTTGPGQTSLLTRPIHLGAVAVAAK